MSATDESRVIGYFAFSPKMNVLCEGDACIIAGSERSLKEYLGSLSPLARKEFRIRKARFGEILKGLQLGAPYAFDEASYNRFFPLANRRGYNLKKEEFSVPTEIGRHFVVIKP